MATTYVVFREITLDSQTQTVGYEIEHQGIEATNSEQARRKVAETLEDSDLEAGVTLIAVPERNWRTGRGTLKAETTRRIRSA